MRIRAALVAAAAAAAAFVPAQSASAVCLPLYTLVTGECSPCTHVNAIARDLHDKLGTPAGMTNCLA